jgi:hypothetical protein
MSVLHRPGARRGEEFHGMISMNLLFLTWLAQRHGLGGETQVAVGMMTAALDAVAKAATAG